MLAAVAGALLVATWAMAVGRYGGPDEPAHVVRAAAVASGDWTGTPDDRFAPGYRVVEVPASLATGDPSCYRHDPTVPARCAADRDVPGRVRVASAAGINPPWYYAVVGLPVAGLGAEGSALAHRLVAGALHLLIGAAVVARARPFGRRAVVSCAMVTPAAWFLLGVVNPQTSELLLSMLVWVGVARILAPPEVATPPVSGSRPGSELCWVVLPLAAAVLIRPIAVMVAATVAAVLVAGDPARARAAARSWRTLVRVVGPVAAAIAAGVVWDRVADASWTDPRTAEDVGPVAAVGRAIGGVPSTAVELVASLGWLEYSVGLVVGVAAAATAAVTVVTAIRGDRRMRRLAGVVAVAILTLPVLFEVAAHRRIGFIWQGRYSLPVVAGFLVVVLAARWEPSRRLLRTVVTLVGAVEIATFVIVLRRSTVGIDGPWSMTGPGAWSPLVHPWILVGANLAALAGLAVALIPRSGDASGRPSRPPGRVTHSM